jgi:O-antigen/teichoic acid export membrane protein
MGEKILRMGVGLLVGIWVARYLGPERFGLLSYAQSLVGLFAAIAGLGLNGILVRELVKSPDKQTVLLGTAFRLKLIGALLVLIILAIAVKLTHQDSLTSLLVFIIASATVFQSFNVIDIFFQAKVLSKYVVYANIFSLLISSLIKVGLILMNAPLIAFAWVVAFDSLILVLGFVYFFQRYANINLKQLAFNKAMAVDLLKDSWPLILSGIVISVYMRIDQVMIKEMLDSEAVGQYAVAVRFSELWYFIPMAIVSSVSPAIVNALKKDERIFYNRIQTLYDFFFVLSLGVAIISSVWSEDIILLTFGEQYLPASDILTVYIWASIFVFHGCIRGEYLVALNKQVVGLQFRVIGVVINIILNYFLIKEYGTIGAAYATVISFALPVYLLAMKHDVLRRDLLITWKAYLFLWVFKK